MSINSTGISSSPSAANAAQMALRQQMLRQRPASQVAPAATAHATANAKNAPTAAASAALPVEAPAGTDPDLWKVLTSSERTFFAKAGAMGPLTYGRVINDSQRNATPAVRGGRLDIRG